MARKGSLWAAYEGFGRQVKRMQEEHEKYLAAIEWALGTNGEFRERRDGEGPYWWRKELMLRAGLKWSGEKFTDNNVGPT